MVEADERDHAARCRQRARSALRDPALSQRRRRRSGRPYRAVEQGRDNLIKVAVETALGLRPKLQVFGTDYQTLDGTCVRDDIHITDLVRAHSDALRHLRSDGESLTLNCGYGHGFSVLGVIDAVKRASGVDFRVETAPRRAGDPAQIVADSRRVRVTLGWRPRFDDLSVIVTHALAWERELMNRRAARTERRPQRDFAGVAPAGSTRA
jgi:UDP-glucose 4-epimerase